MVKIAHLADIHIQDRRRAEYAVVFNRLYESLRTNVPDIIVLAGDIFDNKMRASAHNLEDVANFLTNLVKIAPVVMIPGNHDTNCLTPGELDLLTPLISEHNALQPPNLTYWRSSGVYSAHGMIWTVIATDGVPPTFAEEDEFTAVSDSPHICLFHEEVNGASMPNGTAIGGFKLSMSSFMKYDLTMGGHIHLRQLFGSRAAYCGSLIQQNIGEHHNGHGYILWDLQPSTLIGMHSPWRSAIPRAQFIDIPNESGFVRILVDHDGNDITEPTIPTTPLYWELIYNCPNPPAKLVAEYEERFAMPPRAVRPKYDHGGAGAMITAGVAGAATPAHDLSHAQVAARTFTSHEEIIRELIQDTQTADAVITLHRENWKDTPIIAGGKFRLLRFEFDNMYAFGTSNAIDFSNLEGCVSGVIAPNHTGKSSLIEALLFTLYEEHPRAPHKRNVIHRGATGGSAILDFELDGKLGRIEKHISNGHQQNSYRFQYNCEDRTRGGTTETLREIESVIGCSLNALASSFQLQGGESGGFIGGNPSARKKLLALVMNLGSFEALEVSTTRELAAVRSEIKVLTSQYHGSSLESIHANIAKTETARGDALAAVTEATDRVAAARALVTSASFKLGEATARHTAAAAAVVGYTRVCGEAATSPQMKETDLQTRINRANAKLQELCTQDSQTNVSLEDRLNRLNAAKVAFVTADAELNRMSAMEVTRRDSYDASEENIIRDKLAELRNCIASVPPRGAAQRGVPRGAAQQGAPHTVQHTIEAAKLSLDNKREWSVASKHVAKIATYLKLCDDCIGCKHTKAIFDKLNCTERVEAELSEATDIYAQALQDRLDILSAQSREFNEWNRHNANLTAAQYAVSVARDKLKSIVDECGDPTADPTTAAGQSAAFAADWIATADQAAASLSSKIEANKVRESNIVKLRKFIVDSTTALEIMKNAETAERLYKELDEAASAVTIASVEYNNASAEAAKETTALAIASATATAIDHDLLRLSIEQTYEENRLTRLNACNEKQTVLHAYRTILKPVGGIGDRLLEKGRALLNQKINEALIELGAKFKIEILADYDVSIHNRTIDNTKSVPTSLGSIASVPTSLGSIASVPASLGSGYQKFVLSLAARLAIWRLSTSPRPDAFIIDEGFGACDEEYLEAMAIALESLASAPGGPHLVFIVSHVDTLKTRLERYLEIEVLPAGSRVTNTIQQNIIRRTITDRDSGADVIGPDHEKIGNVYCQVCKQSVTTGRLGRHLSSQKHTEALKRAAQ
jgi:DNA repair exonuclease SbcCD ATPase subunit/predicted phosphodiesterase